MFIKKYFFMLVLIFMVGCSQTREYATSKIQATLSDGQTIVGQLSTRELVLESNLGELIFDAADAGELGLLEGENVEQSGNQIRLWLRNGSEFIGQWKKPSVTIDMSLGGKLKSIKIPINKLKRLQFQSEAVWPEQPVFRIVTNQGDDFFVDVTKTQMIFSNEMGSFAPFLSEIMQLEKKENNVWRIFLDNGSVFLGKLEQDNLNLHLSMGPKQLNIPLTVIKRMNKEIIYKPNMRKSISSLESTDFEELDDSFFSNEEQKNAKKNSKMLNE